MNEKKIAVKVVDLVRSKQDSDTVQEEVRIFRELKHDNIIGLIHSQSETDVLFSVTP